MSTAIRECISSCDKFRCYQNHSAYLVKRKGNRKLVWCSWIDDACDGPWCKFGLCTARKIDENSKCKSMSTRLASKSKLPENSVMMSSIWTKVFSRNS
ncbi:MAG: hypothetical protein EAX81_01565 [Candidatus Thorarchaeota archaeon]|nr:hypothetical protein [Candidatus Thorarchaeota archaeon]